MLCNSLLKCVATEICNEETEKDINDYLDKRNRKSPKLKITTGLVVDEFFQLQSQTNNITDIIVDHLKSLK